MRSLPGRRPLRIAVTAALTIALTATAGCSNPDSTTEANSGSTAANTPLKGATFTVGSKAFTEQLVLCQITSLALRAAGATVEEKCGLHGSNVVRAALTSGSIDMYWEYTGTAWINHLKHTEPIRNATQQYDAVAQEDLTQYKIKWLKASPANNTYAIAVKTSTATELGVKTISDYAKLVSTDPAKATMCVANEFASRSDGFPGVQKAYGFTVAPGELATLETGAILQAVGQGKPCNFGQATTTDGRIQALNLTVLDDDKQFFPIYNPALNVRESVYNDHTDLAKIIEPIALALTNEVLQQLNGEVDVKGQDPTRVAQTWLQTKGFIGK